MLVCASERRACSKRSDKSRSHNTASCCSRRRLSKQSHLYYQ
jgi:hypothetical protein